MNREEKIDAFLLNRMTPEEVAAFSREIEQDETLRQEVDRSRDVVKSIRKVYNEKLIEAIKKTDPRVLKKWTHRKRYILKKCITVLSVAASIVLIYGIFWIFQQQKVNFTNQLYAENYTAYLLDTSLLETNEIVVRDDASPEWDEPTKKDIKKGICLYQQADFDEALLIFKKYSHLASDHIHFFMAMTLLELQEYEQAADCLENLKTSPNYREKAKWYQALCLVKVGNLNKAKEVLLSIEHSSLKLKANLLVKRINQEL